MSCVAGGRWKRALMVWREKSVGSVQTSSLVRSVASALEASWGVSKMAMADLEMPWQSMVKVLVDGSSGVRSGVIWLTMLGLVML